ncbi:MAG: PLP-dependent transferase [Actinomycetota bacterium]|nr:PLP-dependent transferase [Actinomycetota bacterium]
MAIREPSLRAQALADLRDDFEELRFLCEARRECSPRLARWSEELAAERRPLAGVRDRYADLIRREYAYIAALAAGNEWQSPSFAHSLRSQAGRQEGRILAHVDDYKRDRHADAAAYEAAYLRELVGVPGVSALATSCGMAALTTILWFLAFELRLDGPILLGRGSYHETKELVTKAFAGRVVEVEEAELRRAMAEVAPSALFVDSLCNSRGLAVPDLDAMLAAAGCWTVVDNTCLGPGCRPFSSRAPRLLVWESLLKLAQFGLDRANAGILLARGPETERLSALREHLGTNAPDTAILSLPPPSRARLERRLARLERNAALLAERLGGFYPGVGPLVGLDVAEPGPWIARALEQARRRGVQVAAGTSFGFDHTRVYVTAPGLDSFLRIAPGTEDRLRIETVAEALSAAA